MLALGTPCDDEGLWLIAPNEEKLNIWQKGGELEEASVSRFDYRWKFLKSDLHFSRQSFIGVG